MKILQEGDPTLRLKCREVFNFSEARDIIKEMIASVNLVSFTRAKPLGLAANQVGFPVRIIIVNQGGPWIPMINPVIVRAEGEQRTREGCLSIDHCMTPHVRTRPAFVQVEYLDEKGQPQRRKAKGINAAVIHHEVDHLNGILMTDQPAAVAA